MRALKDFYRKVRRALGAAARALGAAARALGAAARALVARRAPPAPGRFALNRKASVHGFIGVSPAPPWREYLLYLPRRFAAIRKAPLVVWIHGCRQDPEEFAAGTRIARFADER